MDIDPAGSNLFSTTAATSTNTASIASSVIARSIASSGSVFFAERITMAGRTTAMGSIITAPGSMSVAQKGTTT